MSPQKPTTTDGYIISKLKIVLCFIAFTVCLNNFAQGSERKAFPTAYGSGSETTGGEGGVLVIVNTTNPNTPITYNASNNTWSGGFKDACNNATIGNNGRIIIFSVSGNIDLGGTNFDLYRHNVTILGQSAPEGGVTLYNGTFRLNSADNVIVRYLRCRNGLATQSEMNTSGNSSAAKSAGISVVNGCTNIIIDHVSASWGGDKAILLGSNGPYDQNNQTVQRCLLSDSHTMMQMSSQNTDLYNDGLRGDLSCYLNMFARGSNRTPNIGGTGGYIDVINNVVQSDGSKLGVLQIIDNAKVNWARNWTRYMGGGSSVANSNEFQMNYTSGSYYDDLQLYARGNYYKNNSGVILDGTEDIDKNDNLEIWSYRMGPSNISQDTSMPDNLFTVETEFNSIINKPPTRTALEAYTSIVTERNAGACHYIKNDGTVGSYIDSWDSDLFTNLEAETMQEHGNVSNWILPSIPQNTRPSNFSTLGDGIEDGWRATNMNGQNYNDIAPSGYMWIEEFYNQVDSPIIEDIIVDQVTINSNAPNNTICEGETITLIASGADSYEWMPGNINGVSIDVNPTSNTTYTVTGTHSDGSTTTDNIVVAVNPIPVANAGDDVETCQGTAVTLTANTSDGYLWSTGATTQSISVNPNTTTTYSVEVTQNGCTSPLDEVVVTVNALPNVDAGLDVSLNFGDSITLTASGANSYEWSTGETTQSITVSPTIETIYSVIGTTGTCQSTDSVMVFIIGNEVVANAGNDQTICNGSQTTLTASGGAVYAWNTGQTTASIDVSPNATTTYTVTVFDVTGTVSDTDEVIVNVNDLPNIDAGSDVTITVGDMITLTAIGADSYEWSTGETSQNIDVSPTNTTVYSVTGFSNGCQSNDEVTVTVETETVLADAGSDQSICEGETAILTASGGATYLWSTGEDTASIEVSPNNSITYSVTVFSASGNASDTDEVMVNVLGLPNVSAGPNISINTGETITLTASGATSYLWNTGENTSSIQVAPDSETTYTVTGYSNAGCEATDEITVFIETEPVDANAGDDISICQGETVTLTATGGVTYLWNTGESTPSINVNPNNSSTYTVTVFNTLGDASASDDVIVYVLGLPNTNAGMDVTISEGETVTLTATGASSYLWNTGDTTNSIVVSPSTDTTYSVTGYTNAGCESTDDITVFVETETVIAAASEDQTICEGETITLTASGGTTYLWNTGETTTSIEVNPNTTTTYTVTVFNALATDSDSEDVIVTVNALPSIDAGTDVTITEGENTILTANGADSYEWSTGETTQIITVNPTSTTSYSVTGFLNGCSATDDVTVTVETENVIANAGVDQSICEGESVTLIASGGTTYQWNTGETTASIEVNPNTTTTYTVTAFNTFGTDSDSDEVTVTVNELPSIETGLDVTISEGESTTLTASGGDSYQWSTGETTQSITVNPTITTEYSVTGFLNGCEANSEVTVIVVPIVFVANAGEDQSICEGTSTTLTASEGDAYLWSTGETTQSINVSPWASETYTVTVFDDDEQAQDDVTVYVNLNPNVVIMNGGEVTILEGEFVTLSATGANTYEWDNGATQPNIAVSPSTSRTYSVTGYINNCSDDKSITVNVLETVQAYAGEDLTICSNDVVTLTADGGIDGEVEYLWNNGETTQSIDVAPGTDTEYSVVVYNALTADESAVTVFVNDCSPEEIIESGAEFDVLVYQDMNADVLKLQISGMDRVDVKQIMIYDLNGKTIYREQITANEELLTLDKEINLSQFSRGVYVVRLTYNDTEILKKIPIR
ncbi:T9SS type A sorting domain-containing protein [Psychroserpens sp.]|uniref:T9SS type A sorting domain-containing protein n=1 Tax=Psychroserpens sp. TaxID=2020870 RepID=UPI00385AD757